MGVDILGINFKSDSNKFNNLERHGNKNRIPDERYIRERVEEVFQIYYDERLPDGWRFYINPKSPESIELFKKNLLQFIPFYQVELGYRYGEMVLEFRRVEEKERRWINLILLIATIASTTMVGATFTPDFNIFEGLKFSIAIMFVLGSHEMGHFVAARMWGMKTTLPYFIPFPTIIGTLGAVIRHKGHIPNRTALFDVGVSGPLVGVVASIIVTAIGLSIPFTPPVQRGQMLELGTPLLFDAIALLMGAKSEFIHPVAFAGWVGMLVTFFNLLPVGQLDGGHIVRAMIGKKAEYVSKSIPFILIMGGWILSFVYSTGDSILVFWGLIALIFSFQRHPRPLNDEIPIDKKRFITGIFTMIIAILCFNPVPFRVI